MVGDNPFCKCHAVFTTSLTFTKCDKPSPSMVNTYPQLSTFFLRKLFQGTRLYIKGIVRRSASKCAWQCELLYVVINCNCGRFVEVR